MHNGMYSPSGRIRKRERLEYIHVYVYNIHIFTCTLHVHCTLYSPSQGIRKRERERLECRLGQDQGLGGKLELGF